MVVPWPGYPSSLYRQRALLLYVHSVATVLNDLWGVRPGPDLPGLDARPAALHAQVFGQIWTAALVFAVLLSPVASPLLEQKRKEQRQLHRPGVDGSIALASTSLPTFRLREWLGIVRPL